LVYITIPGFLATLDSGFSLLSFSLGLVGRKKIKENVRATELFWSNGLAVYFSRLLRFGRWMRYSHPPPCPYALRMVGVFRYNS